MRLIKAVKGLLSPKNDTYSFAILCDVVKKLPHGTNFELKWQKADSVLIGLSHIPFK